jgi:hypothetical protein
MNQLIFTYEKHIIIKNLLIKNFITFRIFICLLISNVLLRNVIWLFKQGYFVILRFIPGAPKDIELYVL